MSFFNIRAAASIAVVAFGAALAVPGSAAAQQCSVQPPEIGDFQGTGVLPPPEEQAAALDVIHTFAWTLDLQDLNNFDNLFASEAVYEACTGGGVQITRTSNLAALKEYFNTQPFAYLRDLSFKTNHFVTNAVFRRMDKEDDEIKVWAAMLVTLQRPDVEAPVLDYTAMLVMTLRRYDGVLKFSDVQMHTGTPVVVFRAR
jgi:hypothetical protein